jgi:hypothetical protein
MIFGHLTEVAAGGYALPWAFYATELYNMDTATGTGACKLGVRNVSRAYPT